MKNVDYRGNGKINYSEFIAATIQVKNVLTYEKLYSLFKYFDTDDSGEITPANLKEAFAKSGKELSDIEVKEILEKHNIKKTGSISFEEFKVMLMEDSYGPST